MYLSMHCWLIILLRIVPGILAESPSLTVNPATAKLGEDVTFTFTPTVGTAVSWFESDEDGVEGDPIISNLFVTPQPNGKYSLNSNGYLIISDVTKADTGYYLCIATISTGGNVEGFSTLTVHYLETPTLEPNNTYYVNETEIATFTCSLPDGNPTSITITWIKDGDVLNVSDNEKYRQSDTTLEIIRVNKLDEGDYKCRAENTAYSGDEGKLSITGTLSVHIPLVPTTTIDAPTTTLTTKASSTTSSQQPVIHETTSTSSGGSDVNKSGSTPIIIGVVIGLMVLVALIIVGGFIYKNDKLCFSRNAKTASGGGSEKLNLKSNFSDIADIDTNTYAQVQKPKQVKATESKHSKQAVTQTKPPDKQAVTQTKPPDKPQRAPSRDRANVEQLTYADLDLVKSEAKVIHTDPETTYSSVQNEKQLTYADLDLTKDVNIGDKDKIIRTQPETEYSSVMITRK